MKRSTKVNPLLLSALQRAHEQGTLIIECRWKGRAEGLRKALLATQQLLRKDGNAALASLLVSRRRTAVLVETESLRYEEYVMEALGVPDSLAAELEKS